MSKKSIVIGWLLSCPLMALASPQLPQDTIGVRLFLLLIEGLVPIMPAIGEHRYGVGAWLQLPVILTACGIVFLMVRTSKIGRLKRVGLVAITYVLATLITNHVLGPLCIRWTHHQC